MKITVLAGGVGGAKFIRGLRAAAPDAEITVVVNTGDDLWLSGVRLQPDLDSILYTLAGVNDEERGWGRVGESERVSAEVKAWGAGWPWFTLGDLDLGTHLARTGWLREGLTPAEVADRLSRRWPLGVRLIPMTNQEVDTHVEVDSGTMHFQEWWTRHRAQLRPRRFTNPGMDHAVPAPGVLEAISSADALLCAPSNPVVSIGPILAVPGLAAAVRATAAGTAGVSPIIGGAVVRGMADVCLDVIGVESSAVAVGRHFGRRDDGGLLDAWLIGTEDRDLAGVDPAWMHVRPLWMSDQDLAATLASDALDLALGR
jgi:LPPG:FO 2-phospho-L-lactate transferase